MEVFRFFRPSGERREDRPEKRRAQVRKAQQTYRIRKDQYTRSLENEVARLRTIETDLVCETQRLLATIETLGNHLVNCGIDVPTSLWGVEGMSASDASFAGHNSGSSSHMGKGVSLELPPRVGAAALPVMPTVSVPSQSEAPHPRVSLSVWPGPLQNSHLADWQDVPPVLSCRKAPIGELQVPAIPVTSRHKSARLGDFDPTIVGMEFVLALEAPCLGHVHGDLENPDRPSGHALTISAHLLFLSPQSPLPPDAEALNEAYERAPASVLNRLLTLSTNLALEDEVTPVQAWNHIRRQPRFGELEVEKLRSLTKKLVEAIKCHGFGTAFKEKVFEKMVREALLEGRPF